MDRTTLVRGISLLCLVLGFAAAVNLLGPREKMYTVKEGDSFFEQPTVTAEQQAAFKPGTELVVLEILNMAKPTAVVMAQDVLAEGADGTRYKLQAGDVYKIIDARLEKGNTLCLIEVPTVQGTTVQLDLDKSELRPVDEGQWLYVAQKDRSSAGWVRIQSNWY